MTIALSYFLPELDVLHERFTGDFRSGELIWKPKPCRHSEEWDNGRRWNKRNAGKQVVTKGNRVNIASHLYDIPMIVWKLVTGDDPPPGTCVILMDTQQPWNNSFGNCTLVPVEAKIIQRRSYKGKFDSNPTIPVSHDGYQSMHINDFVLIRRQLLNQRSPEDIARSLDYPERLVLSIAQHLNDLGNAPDHR